MNEMLTVVDAAEHELLQQNFITGCTEKSGGQCGEENQRHVWPSTRQTSADLH